MTEAPTASPTLTAPEPIEQPKLAAWVWARGLEWREAGELFEVSGEAVRLWCLPFSDPRRRKPRPVNMIVIDRVTKSEIGPDDFEPPVRRVLQ